VTESAVGQAEPLSGRATATPPTLTGDSRLELVDLSIVEQDSGFIVGDPVQGAFIQLPHVGVAVIERLRTGASIAEVTAMFRSTAGGAAPDERSTSTTSGKVTGDVDVLDFANALVELGFVKVIDGIPISTAIGASARRWLTGPRPERIRWLFSGPAWIVYSLLFVGCVATEIVSPSYRPHASDYFFLSDPLASIAILTLLSFATAGGHECFHWLAGSAQGVSARFAISRRLYFLVFETDLTQLWSLPRRRRYGPLLAGMAFDTTILAVTIIARFLIASGTVTAPPLARQLLAAIAVMITTKLAWQFCVFLRNDLYLVLSAVLGCVNLWRISMLTVKKAAWRLTPGEQAELAAADDHSRQHARWYSWLCVAGVAGAAWFAAYLVAPMIWRVIRSLANQMATSPPASPRFWEALAFGVLAFLPLALMLHVLLRDICNTRRNRPGGSQT
jgi:putative peptide zinc metalloprotease protein